MGCEPDEMGIGPVYSVPKLLKSNNMSVNDIDLWELNEAFAVQVAYCRDQLGISMDKLNVNGGSISIGHPFGMTGSRQVGHIVRELTIKTNNLVLLPCALVVEWAQQVCLKDTQVKISSEFSIIKKYLSGIGASYLKTNGVELSVGDDCAVLATKSKLLISTDTSVSGVHFLKSMPSQAIAYRAVAIALSDIAAMGGQPVAFSLSLIMPSFDSDWMLSLIHI